MTVKIKKQAKDTSLIRIIEEMADVDLNVCYQCKNAPASAR